MSFRNLRPIHECLDYAAKLHLLFLYYHRVLTKTYLELSNFNKGINVEGLSIITLKKKNCLAVRRDKYLQMCSLQRNGIPGYHLNFIPDETFITGYSFLCILSKTKLASEPKA